MLEFAHCCFGEIKNNNEKKITGLKIHTFIQKQLYTVVACCPCLRVSD